MTSISQKLGYVAIAALNIAALAYVSAGHHTVKATSSHDRWNYRMAEQDQETVRNAYPLATPGSRATVEVDNVWGSIEVVPGSSDKVELVLERTNNAESKDDLARAKKDVTLDVTNKDNALRFYVDGPFRCGHDCTNCVHEDNPRYIVKMNFQLRVPADTDLVLNTVNDGEIKVHGVKGRFTVRNVNGAITMDDITGSGSAKTVNGAVKVSFRENPTLNSDFDTINGDVDLHFARNLSADLFFKTMNGDVYTDFNLTALPASAPQSERRNGKFIIRSNHMTSGRVGNGGPEIRIQNLNGEIHVLQNSI